MESDIDLIVCIPEKILPLVLLAISLTSSTSVDFPNMKDAGEKKPLLLLFSLTQKDKRSIIQTATRNLLSKQ